MQVNCPYDDCRKSFNRLICPNPRCNNIIYMKLGLFKMGQQIKCFKLEKILILKKSESFSSTADEHGAQHA